MMCNMMAKRQPASSESGESLPESPGGSPTHQSATRTTSLRWLQCQPAVLLCSSRVRHAAVCRQGPSPADEAEVCCALTHVLGPCRRHSGQRMLSSHSGSLGVQSGGHQALSRPSSSGALGRGLSGADLAAGALSGGSTAVGPPPRKMF